MPKLTPLHYKKLIKVFEAEGSELPENVVTTL